MNDRTYDENFEDEGWISEEGGDKNALVSENTFQTEGATTATAPSTASQREGAAPQASGDHALRFERVVIGAPGLETLERRGMVSSSTKARPK